MDWNLDTTYLYDYPYGQAYFNKKNRTAGPYIVHGDPSSNKLIMTFGGSTTTSANGDERHLKSTLIDYLYKYLLDQGIKDLCILNGACHGHNSWQEYSKMSRDLSEIKPSLIISYSGINDAWAHTDINYPQINPWVLGQFPTKILEQLFAGVNTPIVKNQRPISHLKYWIHLSQCMHSICDVHKVKFLRILQPSLGYGGYVFNLLKESEKVYHKWATNHNDPGLKAIKKFYSEAEEILDYMNSSYIKNYSHIYDNMTELFSDLRHPNDRGYSIAAEYIMKDIKNLFPSWF